MRARTTLATDRVDDWRTAAALEALRAYALAPETVTLHALNQTNNLIFRVDVGRPPDHRQAFVLRIHRSSDLTTQELDSELAWLEALNSDTDLRVPVPVRTADGTRFGTVSVTGSAQPRYHVLFHWLDARFVPTRDQDARAATQVGVFIGSLHQHARSFVPGPDFRRRRLDAAHIIDWTAIDAVQQAGGLFTAAHRRLFAQVQGRTRQAFDRLDTRSTSFGLIHADLIAKNYFFHDRGVGAVDFDDCGWGYYLYDLAPALVGYFDEAHYAALRAGLLAGYRQVCSLPCADEPLLDTLMAARHVVSCCWLARRLDDPLLAARAPAIVAYRTAAIRALLKQR